MAAEKIKRLKVSKASRLKLQEYLTRLLDHSKNQNTDLRNRLDAIDYAYTRYQAAMAEGNKAGIDKYGNTPCNAGPVNIITPVVLSQTQSMVAYWSEVFLSGYPIFPVVSNPAHKDQAESLEGIVQDHLVLSESIPELQLLLQNAARYNLWAVETAWEPIKTYKPFTDIADLAGDNTESKEIISKINVVRNLNLRNLHYDSRVPLHKVDSLGEYVGYTDVFTRMSLKDLLNSLSSDGTLVSFDAVNKALTSAMDSEDYNEDPLLNSYVSNTGKNRTDWDAYGGWSTPSQGGANRVPTNTTGTYLVHKFYLRLVPSDFGLDMAAPNSVHTILVRMVNRDTIISVEEFTGAMGRFGIVMGPAIEDGLDIQTQSYAEMAMPIQSASTSLLNIRFAGARRAIMDRGLYNPDMIRPSDINSPFPEAKIPIKPNQLTENSMDQAYRPMPFDSRGTETVLQDAMLIQDMSREHSGMNSATRGQFQKGNRTMAEFDTIMGNAENRMRLPALVLEYRCFSKIKEQLKLNILQYGTDTVVISPRNGKELAVNIQELQELRMQFEMADGYTPKSKMASTDYLVTLLQLIMNSPQLQQVYGNQMAGMFAHLAQLGGVRGLQQYADAALQEFQTSMEMQMQMQQLMQQLQQAMAQQGQPTQQPPVEGEVQQ